MQEPPTPTLLPTPAQGDEPIVQPDGSSPSPPERKPKLKKLRLAFILLGIAVIALISTIFGMLMAVGSDLPALENQAEYKAAKNSVLLADTPACRKHADQCTELARLTGNNNRILLGGGDVSPFIKNAVIAIEDRRFYSHQGVDYWGIARALWQDIRSQHAAQGGSTITQQFVKNALSAQGNRSVLQKLRESALAYHLERKWSKEKILTQYLNTVYFGNGAYGVESAMRTYFGNSAASAQQPTATVSGAPLEPAIDRRRPLASDATPVQGATLAALIASPSGFDPVRRKYRFTQRRNAVLKRMLELGSISNADYQHAILQAPPDETEVNPPKPDSDQPYFSTWLTQQLVDRYGPGVVFGGGLRIRTTLDPELQAAAEQALSGRLSGVGPAAALVAIENKTGEIKAMVGGKDYDESAFNLATDGHRQPGSAFKPFTLITALGNGISPDSTWASQQKVFPVPGSGGKEKFVVNNYQDSYSGITSLRSATATSDNSVFAEVGLKVGTGKIARVAEKMGIRTPVSTNPAMTLGGLKQGVTPLEMAYAYSTIANKGVKVSGSLAPGGEGPVAIEQVDGRGIDRQNDKRSERVFPGGIGTTTQELLAGVIQGGTGRAAQIGEPAAGKTGTTENYGDAWFVGFNKDMTVAVWVGYADKLQAMKTEYHGGPVAGGTYPAEIWHDFMSAWLRIRDARDAADGKTDESQQTTPGSPLPPLPGVPGAEQGTPSTDQQPTPEQRQNQGGQAPKTPRRNPAPTPSPTPAPERQGPAPQGGGGGGVAAG
jgi:penicillin-binding protein 1A